MLKTNPPELPVWMESFIDLAESQQAGRYSSFRQETAWRPTEVEVSIKPELIEIGAKIEVKATVRGRPDSPPEVTLTQANTTARSQMKESQDMFLMTEYAAVLSTAEFKPGMAQLTVKGRVGEEDIVYTDELVLERATAVEGVNSISTESGGYAALENRVGNSYPNPFNPDVWIPYQLSRGAPVTVEIYNSMGQLIRILDLGYKFPGRYVDVSKAAHWDGRNSHGEQVSSGMYFYKLQAGDFVAMGKMIAVK
jgi:hypothetical protein